MKYLVRLKEPDAVLFRASQFNPSSVGYVEVKGRFENGTEDGTLLIPWGHIRYAEVLDHA